MCDAYLFQRCSTGQLLHGGGPLFLPVAVSVRTSLVGGDMSPTLQAARGHLRSFARASMQTFEHRLHSDNGHSRRVYVSHRALRSLLHRRVSGRSAASIGLSADNGRAVRANGSIERHIITVHGEYSPRYTNARELLPPCAVHCGRARCIRSRELRNRPARTLPNRGAGIRPRLPGTATPSRIDQANRH
jgi:hypothetical protein